MAVLVVVIVDRFIGNEGIPFQFKADIVLIPMFHLIHDFESPSRSTQPSRSNDTVRDAVDEENTKEDGRNIKKRKMTGQATLLATFAKSRKRSTTSSGATSTGSSNLGSKNAYAEPRFQPDAIFGQVCFKGNETALCTHDKRLGTRHADDAEMLLRNGVYQDNSPAAAKLITHLAAKYLLSKLDTPLPKYFFSSSLMGPLSGQTFEERVLEVFFRAPELLNSRVSSLQCCHPSLKELVKDGYETGLAGRALAACACNIGAARILLSQ